MVTEDVYALLLRREHGRSWMGGPGGDGVRQALLGPDQESA